MMMMMMMMMMLYCPCRRDISQWTISQGLTNGEAYSLSTGEAVSDWAHFTSMGAGELCHSVCRSVS